MRAGYGPTRRNSLVSNNRNATSLLVRVLTGVRPPQIKETTLSNENTVGRQWSRMWSGGRLRIPPPGTMHWTNG